MAAERSDIQRFENKYVITERMASVLRQRIAPFCRRDANAGERGYLIHSLYFDTPEAAFYQANLDKQLVRYKPRVRTYVPDCPWVWLELKCKRGERVSKSRVRIEAERWPAILGAARPSLDPRLVAPDSFLHVVDRHGCVPACHVRYRREAWVSEVDTYLRITFDREIATFRANDLPDLDIAGGGGRSCRLPCDDPWAFEHHGLESMVILEIKCERLLPDWISGLVENCSLCQRGISKYVLARQAEARAEPRISRHLDARR